MDWSISFSKSADKFLLFQHIDDDTIRSVIFLAVQKFEGKDVNIQIKKLAGKWEGYYRVRVGKIRIICEFDFKSEIVKIEKVDFRGNVYK